MMNDGTTKSGAGANKALTWAELQAIEKRRRRILRHGNQPFLRILTFWEGTVWHALATDPLVYFVVLVYIVTRVAARTSIPQEFVSTFDSAEISVIGTFMTFFLVIYVNATNSRFNILYDASMACKGRILDAAALAKSCMPRERALRLNRYMNAAVRVRWRSIFPPVLLTNTIVFD
jgi:Bestrophin, RFP-TM, chloride channel